MRRLSTSAPRTGPGSVSLTTAAGHSVAVRTPEIRSVTGELACGNGLAGDFLQRNACHRADVGAFSAADAFVLVDVEDGVLCRFRIGGFRELLNRH